LAESRENKHAALLLRAEELRKKLCETMDYGMELDKQVELEVKLRDEYWNRALAAEKHNALLLEEREASKPKEPIPDTPHWIWREGQGYVLEKSGLPYETPWEAEARIQTAADKCEPIPAHWQRFKSWLSRWEKPEIIVLIAVFGVALILGLITHWLARKQGG
jgi:hypothetical protein